MSDKNAFVALSASRGFGSMHVVHCAVCFTPPPHLPRPGACYTQSIDAASPSVFFSVIINFHQTVTMSAGARGWFPCSTFQFRGSGWSTLSSRCSGRLSCCDLSFSDGGTRVMRVCRAHLAVGFCPSVHVSVQRLWGNYDRKHFFLGHTVASRGPFRVQANLVVYSVSGFVCCGRRAVSLDVTWCCGRTARSGQFQLPNRGDCTRIHRREHTQWSVFPTGAIPTAEGLLHRGRLRYLICRCDIYDYYRVIGHGNHRSMESYLILSGSWMG